MNEPSTLSEIGIRCLSKYLFPLVTDEPICISELSYLTPRLGNLLLKTLLELKRADSFNTTDYFLSLFSKASPKSESK